MDDLLIVGAGGLGKMTLEAAAEKFNCFFVDDKFDKGTIICGTSVIGNTKDLLNLRKNYNYAIVAIGNNNVRQRLTESLLMLGFNLVSIISSKAYVSRFSKIGRGCIVLPYACIQNGSNLGDGVVLCSLVDIHHDSCLCDFSLIYPNSTIRTGANIGKRTKIGSNVTVTNHTSVAKDSVIEDGSTIF